MEIIKGSKAIIEDYGYWPSFHDDYIEKVVINSKDIEVTIKPETLPEDYAEYPIRFLFHNVKEFELQGELHGICSIILDLTFEELKERHIKSIIYSSLGLNGHIVAEEISVEKLL